MQYPTYRQSLLYSGTSYHPWSASLWRPLETQCKTLLRKLESPHLLRFHENSYWSRSNSELSSTRPNHVHKCRRSIGTYLRALSDWSDTQILTLSVAYPLYGDGILLDVSTKIYGLPGKEDTFNPSQRAPNAHITKGGRCGSSEGWVS